MVMVRQFVISACVVMTLLPAYVHAADEHDEGGIVGTGRTERLDRPEIMHRPEVPERIERPAIERSGIEVNERPGDAVNNFSGGNSPAVDRPDTSN